MGRNEERVGKEKEKGKRSEQDRKRWEIKTKGVKGRD